MSKEGPKMLFGSIVAPFWDLFWYLFGNFLDNFSAVVISFLRSAAQDHLTVRSTIFRQLPKYVVLFCNTVAVGFAYTSVFFCFVLSVPLLSRFMWSLLCKAPHLSPNLNFPVFQEVQVRPKTLRGLFLPEFFYLSAPSSCIFKFLAR